MPSSEKDSIPYISIVDKKKKAKIQNDYKVSYHGKRIDNNRKNVFYSVQRIDVILIALATGGIVVGLSVLSKLYEKNAITTLTILSIIAFMATIFLNLMSQHYFIKSARNDTKRSENILKKLHGFPSKEICEDTQSRSISKHASRWCYVTLLSGCVLLIVQLFIASI